MCFDYDGNCEVYHQKVVKGRKDHRCEECNQVMPKGTLHIFVKSLYDAHWSEYRCCARCHFIREIIVQQEIAEGCQGNEASPYCGELKNIWNDGEYAWRAGLTVLDPEYDEEDPRPMTFDEVHAIWVKGSIA